MHKIVSGLVIAGFATISLWAAEHTPDSLETVKQQVAAGKAILVDVREQSEWDAGHLLDAKLAPLSRLQKGIDAAELAKLVPKDKVVYLHCRSGKRCLTAADVLERAGYKPRALKPGYEDLLKAGFPPTEKKN